MKNLKMKKKAMEMSWSMIGWIILSLVGLIILFIIIKSGTKPGFDILDSLGGR